MAFFCGMALHIRIHPETPQPRLIRQVVEALNDGAVIVYPTDTIYGLGCSIRQQKSIERIARLKRVDPAKANLSFICHDLSDLSKYARQLDTPQYRLLKKYLPGPYTFILNASKEVPKILQTKKSTIGLRVPDHAIANMLVQELGNPILSASLPDHDGIDMTDPEDIAQAFDKQVDIIVDGGICGLIPSTIIDLTDATPEIIRQGKGEWAD